MARHGRRSASWFQLRAKRGKTIASRGSSRGSTAADREAHPADRPTCPSRCGRRGRPARPSRASSISFTNRRLPSPSTSPCSGRSWSRSSPVVRIDDLARSLSGRGERLRHGVAPAIARAGCRASRSSWPAFTAYCVLRLVLELDLRTARTGGRARRPRSSMVRWSGADLSCSVGVAAASRRSAS